MAGGADRAIKFGADRPRRQEPGETISFPEADLASSNGASTYTFAGFRAGSSEFPVTGTYGPTGGFEYFASGNPGIAIDWLRISLNTMEGATSYDIYNIRLTDMSTTVPESSTLLLLGSGMGALMYARRRRGG